MNNHSHPMPGVPDGCFCRQPAQDLPGGANIEGMGERGIIWTRDRRFTMTRIFTALIHKEDDWYVADCPEVGTVSQGKTVEEAVANLKEATELYLEEFPLPEISHPLLTTFEVATYA